MVNLIYRCGWCKKITPTHPHRFDHLEYTGSYRSYQTLTHYDLCDHCYKKFLEFIRDNDIKCRRVKKCMKYKDLKN